MYEMHTQSTAIKKTHGRCWVKLACSVPGTLMQKYAPPTGWCRGAAIRHGARGLHWIRYKANLRWSGWLTYSAAVIRIFEGVKIWTAEKICRPGFMYGGVLWKNPYVDQAKDPRTIFSMESLVCREESAGRVLHMAIE
jgi:hypothetical protein